jgi:hypothetical protein
MDHVLFPRFPRQWSTNLVGAVMNLICGVDRGQEENQSHATSILDKGSHGYQGKRNFWWSQEGIEGFLG